MKLNKKKVFVISLAISLIAILSLGSLAWFNAKDEVTNTFKVADSDNPGEMPEFSIDVKENDVDDEGENLVDTDNNGYYDDFVDSNVYEDVVPGDELLKNPVITNTGNYDQWVRVTILISKDFANEVAEAQSTSHDGINFETLFTNFNSAAFEAQRAVLAADTYADYYAYVYYVAAPLAPEGTVKVFDAVNIPEAFTQTDMVYGEDGFQINVKAEAVQVDNIDGPASAAFNTVGWEAATEYDYK